MKKTDQILNIPLIIFILSLSYSASATTIFAERTGTDNPFNGVDVWYNSAPSFVDIDNDGDLDAFIGALDGNINYYENIGTNSNPTFTERTGNDNPLDSVDVGDSSAPTFIDIDNDGDFDAFIGASDGNINYYENTGNNSNPTFTERTGNNNPLDAVDVAYNTVPTFVDIDNDGDFDAFIGDSFGYIYFYENTENNSNPNFTKRTGSDNLLNVDVVFNSAPSFVDIDNDGDFDAFIGDSFGAIYFYENIGTNSNPTFTKKTGNDNPLDAVDVGYYSAPSFVDIDNDGNPDMFVGEEDGNINYYKNLTNNLSFASRTGSDNPFNGVDVGLNSFLDFIDIDNDDDFDAFIGEDNGNINYYENTGNNSNPTFTEKTGNDNPLDAVDVAKLSTPELADIDNDGDFDAFIGERNGSINYYENTGNNSNPTFTEKTGTDNPFDPVNVGTNSNLSFIDIDNDDDFDAFIGEDNGNINYYENTGNNSNPTFTEKTGTDNPFDAVNVGDNSNLSFIDIDNDDDFDAFIGEDNGNINYYENTGNNSNPTFTEKTGTDNPFDTVNVGIYSAPSFVDIDNDGDPDMFVGEEDGNINYFENLGFDPIPMQVKFTNIEINSATFSTDLLTGFGSTTFTIELGESSNSYSTTTSQQFISSSTASVEVSSNISELVPNTRYYARARAENSKTFRYSLINPQYLTSFKTLVAFPEAYSPTFSNIESNSASFTSDFYNGNDSSTLTFEIGLSNGNYSAASSSSTFAASTSTLTGSISYSELLPNTDYFVRARAENSRSYSYSESNSFTTLADLPIAYQPSINNIESNSASFSAEIYNGNDSGTLTFEIGLSNGNYSATTNSSTFAASTSTLTGSISYSELLPNTDYFVRARAENSRSFNYSESNSFTTLALPPQIFNITLDQKQDDSAVFNNLIYNGNDSSTLSIEIGTSTGDYSSTVHNEVAGSTQTFTYSSTIGDLSANTQYFIRNTLTNSLSFTSYEELSFWTLDTEPNSHSSYLYQVGQDENSISLSFESLATIGADGYLLVRKSANADLPEDGTSYESGYTYNGTSVVAVITDQNTDSYLVGGLPTITSFNFKLIPYNIGGDLTTINYFTENVPSLNAKTIPTLGEWAMIIFVGLFAAGGFWYIRRQT